MNKERTRIQRVYLVLDKSNYPYVGDSSRKEFQVDFRGQKLSISRIQTNVSDWDSMDAPRYSYNIVSGDRTFEKYHPQVPDILEFLDKKDFTTFKFDSGGRVYNDQELLEKYRKKQKIGFSARSHLKAKGLIPRSDGKNTTFDSSSPDIRYAKGGLIAPNGKPSNLTPEQYKLVRTPAFKEWFGDWERLALAKRYDSGMDEITLEQLSKDVSKVLDENGEPLVLYRGNLVNQEDLGYIFNLGHDFLKKNIENNFGFFFTNKLDVAKKYMAVDMWDEVKAGSVTSVFINSKKILDLTDFDLKIGQNNFIRGLIEKGVSFDNEYNYLKNKIIDFDTDTHQYWGYNVFDYFDAFPELRNLFIKNGFTSVTFYEMSRVYTKYKVFVAFESNQIKLADGTNTTFDGSNPDIRLESGGQIAYHGTTRKFNVFDNSKLGQATKSGNTAKAGFWFTDDIKTAQSYARAENQRKVDDLIKQGKIKEAENLENKIFDNTDIKYLKTIELKYNNPYIIDAEGSNYHDFENEINEAIRVSKSNGNDVLIIKNLNDNADYSEYTPATHYCVFDNSIINQAKPDIKFADGGMIAPNGQPSNLTPEQWELVRTPEFKAWFGDWENDPANASKVVDENGEPLVVYHGTFRYFNVFEISKDSGFYFTEFKRIAEIYASSVQEGKITLKPNENPRILNCFLNIKSLLKEQVYGIVGKNLSKINKAKKKNFDGLLLVGSRDIGGYYDQYIAFYPEQIKLADGSNTTFDSNNPDIRYADGGETKKYKIKVEEEDDDGDRTKIYIPQIGSITLVQTYPEYEFMDDISDEQLDELGLYEGDTIGKIEHLQIEDKYKGQGYAKVLMREAIQLANKKGLFPLYLNASPMGSSGLNLNDLTKFYESFGFEVFLEQGNNNLMILNMNNIPKAANGMLVGNSHAEGGIKIKTPEGMIEAEGGETIINKRSMASDEILICEGTPKEIASKVNEYGDGVQFAEGGNCRVVSTGETVSSSSTETNNNMAENGMQVTAAEGMRVSRKMKKYTVTSLLDSDISWQADENDLQRYVIESMDEFDFKPGESLMQSMNKMGFLVSTNVYFPDSAAEMAARGTIVRSTDASVRPSPSISATIFDVGTRMTGNDGNTWEIVEDSRGVHRWKRVKMEEGGMMMAADGIQTSPAQKEICFLLDEEPDGSQLWAFIVNDDMDVNFRIDYENRDYDYDVPQWDYRSESTYFNTQTNNADFASGFEMLEVFDKDGEPIEVSDEMKDELNKQIEKVYKSYFKDEAKDDIPRSIKGSIKFEDGGPVNEFTMNVKSSLDALMKYFAEHNNKIHVHGSDYEYNSQTPMYLRVTGGKGATYNIVPFFSKIGSGIYEGAKYYSLVRAAVKKDFALLQNGKLMDLAEDGMEVAEKGMRISGLEMTGSERRLQYELEMLRDDLKDEVITMDEYYQKRNELYNKYGIGKYARGGKVKKMYAILRSPMGEVIADVEVDNEDKNEALKKFRDMGIQEVGSISFTNSPPHYYARGGKLTDKEKERFEELSEKVEAYLRGETKITSKELSEHAKLKHKYNSSVSPEYRKQMEFERDIQMRGEFADGDEIAKANLGYLLAAEKLKNVAPKAFDAADEKVAERIKSKKVDFFYADGGDIDGEKIYIEFLNKRKNFQKDKRYFKTYEDAMNWGRKNLENFHPDMVKIQYSDGGDVKYGKPEFIDYKGESIMFEPINNEYYVNDEMFFSLEDAKKYIDAGSPLSKKMIDAYRHGLFEKGGSIDDKKVIAFVKSLEKAGLMAKGSHTNQRAIDTIKSIVSMSRTEFDEYITENPNRNVNMIYNEYQDWVQTYDDGGGVERLNRRKGESINDVFSRISKEIAERHEHEDWGDDYETLFKEFLAKKYPGITYTDFQNLPKKQQEKINNEYIDYTFDNDQSLGRGMRFKDGGDIDDTERQLRHKMNIGWNTQTGHIYVGGQKRKNILYKDENGFYLIDGYGKFMGKRYPVKKYFTDKAEIEVLERVVNEYSDGGDVKKKLNEPSGPVTGQKIVVFSKKVNPKVTITVKTYPNGQITDIENEYEVRFPYSVGQVLNMGHRTWACSNGYMVNNEDPCGEKKIFGMRASDIPQGHELRTLYPHKFRK